MNKDKDDSNKSIVDTMSDIDNHDNQPIILFSQTNPDTINYPYISRGIFNKNPLLYGFNNNIITSGSLSSNTIFDLNTLSDDIFSKSQILEKKYHPHYNAKEYHIPFKHQGVINSYDVKFNYNAIIPNKPDWLK